MTNDEAEDLILDLDMAADEADLADDRDNERSIRAAMAELQQLRHDVVFLLETTQSYESVLSASSTLGLMDTLTQVEAISWSSSGRTDQIRLRLTT